MQTESGCTTEPLFLVLSAVLFFFCCFCFFSPFFFFFCRLAQGAQYSEDSESGEVLRRRFRSSTQEEEEDEDMDVGILKAKKRRKSWNEQEASSSYSHEVCAYAMALPRYGVLINVKLFVDVLF